MDQMAPPAPSLPDPVREGVTAADIAMLDRLAVLGMLAAEALSERLQQEVAEGQPPRAAADLARVATFVHRGFALKARIANDARRAQRAGSGTGRSHARRRPPRDARKRRVREMVVQAITETQAGPLKTAQLLRTLDTRLDTLDLGAELGDRPLAVIALDMSDALNLKLPKKSIHTDAEMAEARAKLELRRVSEAELVAQAEARAAAVLEAAQTERPP
jgi:hypothetical protein